MKNFVKTLLLFSTVALLASSYGFRKLMSSVHPGKKHAPAKKHLH
jgi:hypothetical protein